MSNPFVRIALAIVFAAVGVVGLIMPILPGWLFFGFVWLLLFPNAPFTRAGVDRLERHFPSVGRLTRSFLPPPVTRDGSST